MTGAEYLLADCQRALLERPRRRQVALVAEQAAEGGLVYIAAFAPDVAQSVGSLGASVEPAAMGAEVRPNAQHFVKLTEALDL